MNGMTRREREITDRGEIVDILNRCSIVHLGLVDGDEPYVVPMNYGYTMDEDGRLTLYLHGATQGRKLDLMRKNPKVFLEMECDVQPFEGDVACRYGTAYKSLMGRGKAVLLFGIAAEMYFMRPVIPYTETTAEAYLIGIRKQIH